MKKALLVVLVLVLSAAMLEAGGVVIRQFKGGQPIVSTPGTYLGRGSRGRSDLFYVLRRYFDLTKEQTGNVNELSAKRAEEERQALAEMRKTLDKKYLALIIEILPGEEKDKYQKVLAAMTERDELMAAARKEFRELLEKIATEQGLTPKASTRYLPYSKTDIVRRVLKLTAEQRKEADSIRKESWSTMREAMRDIERPKNWRDQDQRKKYTEATRKIRDQVNEQIANETMRILTPPQKTAYQTGAAGMDAYTKKTKDAADVCEKKLIALLGEEKVKTFRGYRPRGDTPKKPGTQF